MSSECYIMFNNTILTLNLLNLNRFVQLLFLEHSFSILDYQGKNKSANSIKFGQTALTSTLTLLYTSDTG
jgi:hypothetical protein